MSFVRRFVTKVIRVDEKRRAKSGRIYDRGLPTQRMQVEYESTGWWVFLEGNLSISLGSVKPPLEPGDNIIITLEKAQESP